MPLENSSIDESNDCFQAVNERSGTLTRNSQYRSFWNLKTSVTELYLKLQFC